MTATDEPSAPGRGKRIAGMIALGVFLLMMALGTWHLVAPRYSPVNWLLTRNALPAIPRPNRPATLDPSQVSADAADAYRLAQHRARLMEQLPCYCGCYFKDGHQNAHDCFRDRHAEHCEICLKIARRADELARQGYAAKDIKATIDREFAQK